MKQTNRKQPAQMKETLFPGELSNPSNDGSCTTLLARLEKPSYLIMSKLMRR